MDTRLLSDEELAKYLKQCSKSLDEADLWVSEEDLDEQLRLTKIACISESAIMNNLLITIFSKHYSAILPQTTLVELLIKCTKKCSANYLKQLLYIIQDWHISAHGTGSIFASYNSLGFILLPVAIKRGDKAIIRVIIKKLKPPSPYIVPIVASAFSRGDIIATYLMTFVKFYHINIYINLFLAACNNGHIQLATHVAQKYADDNNHTLDKASEIMIIKSKIQYTFNKIHVTHREKIAKWIRRAAGILIGIDTIKHLSPTETWLLADAEHRATLDALDALDALPTSLPRFVLDCFIEKETRLNSFRRGLTP